MGFCGSVQPTVPCYVAELRHTRSGGTQQEPLVKNARTYDFVLSNGNAAKNIFKIVIFAIFHREFMDIVSRNHKNALPLLFQNYWLHLFSL